MTQTTDIDLREIRDLILGLDKKIDDLDKRVEVNAARTDERLKALEGQVSDLKSQLKEQASDVKEQISDIKLQLRAQDTRLWGFVAAVFVTTLGFLTKLTFFPTRL